MRLFMDTVIALMLVALIGGYIWLTRQNEEMEIAREGARREVHRLSQQVFIRTTMKQALKDDPGYPETIDPSWFENNLPYNPLLVGAYPWVEVAGPDQSEMLHPQERVASERHIAQFWYNPSNGIVRARVPGDLSDSDAVELYNYINNCELLELFADGSLPK